MKRSQKIASQAGEDCQSHLLMSLNHQEWARSTFQPIYQVQEEYAYLMEKLVNVKRKVAHPHIKYACSLTHKRLAQEEHQSGNTRSGVPPGPSSAREQQCCRLPRLKPPNECLRES